MTTRDDDDDDDDARARARDAIDDLATRVGTLDVARASTTTTSTARAVVPRGPRPTTKTRDVEEAVVDLDASEGARAVKNAWGTKTSAVCAFASEAPAKKPLEEGAPRTLGSDARRARREETSETPRGDVSEFGLRPSRARPKTNASVARRMIANALNVKLGDAPDRGDADRRDADRRALGEARRKKAEEKRRAREREEGVGRE